MTAIRKYLSEKAQGLVEYVLILAFIAGVGMSLGGMSGTVKDVVDNTVRLLGGDQADTAAWGKMDRNKLLTEVDNEKRIKADQKTLAKIGELFINKTADEIIAMYLNPRSNNHKPTSSYATTGQGMFIGNYYDDEEQIGTIYHDDNGGWLSDAGVEAIAEAITGSSSEASKTGNMNYGFNGLDTRYFYSDQMVDTMSQANGDGQYSEARSIRVNLHYGTDGKVDAARVKINRGAVSNNNNDTTKSYYGELDVTVKSDKSYKQTISNDDLTTMKTNANDANGRIQVKDSNSYNLDKINGKDNPNAFWK